MKQRANLVADLRETHKVLKYTLVDGEANLGRANEPVIDNAGRLTSAGADLANLPAGTVVNAEAANRSVQLASLLGRNLSD